MYCLQTWFTSNITDNPLAEYPPVFFFFSVHDLCIKIKCCDKMPLWIRHTITNPPLPFRIPLTIFSTKRLLAASRSWIRGQDHGSDNLPARNRGRLCYEARIRDPQVHPLPSAYAIRRKLSNNSGCYRLCYMWLQTMEMYSILKTR